MNITTKMLANFIALRIDFDDVRKRYSEPHRYYHNWDHIASLLNEAEKRDILTDYLFLAIIFHDIIYDPQATDNEEKSAEYFASLYNGIFKQEIIQAILDTKTHNPTNELGKVLCELDLGILHSDLATLIEYEHGIFKEFQYVDWSTYKTERIKVLRKLQKKDELEALISYVDSRKPKIGVYAGSFNPFHKGHYDCLLQAEKLFDKVIIARGKNPSKKNDICELPESIKNRQIEEYDGLTTSFIKGIGYDVTLIRGLRNATDLQNEITQLRFLQDLDPNIKVVSFFCNREFEHISSSAIRELKLFNEHTNYLT